MCWFKLLRHIQLEVLRNTFVSFYLEHPVLQFDENFSRPNTTADSIMSNAISRNLSTIGSCIVYNSKIISLYTHILFNTILTSDQSTHLDKRAIDFIVKSDNRFLVKKIKYFMPHNYGGMN